jgi:hypothetical protein
MVEGMRQNDILMSNTNMDEHDTTFEPSKVLSMRLSISTIHESKYQHK